MPAAPTRAVAPPAPGVAQWLGSLAVALLVNWFCLQGATPSFLLLNALGACSDSALGACVALTALAPALLATCALAALVFALQIFGLLRSWRRSGVLLALVGFVAGAVCQGIWAARLAQAPQAVGEPTSPFVLLQPWVPGLSCGVVLSCWVAWRRRVSRRAEHGAA